MFEVSVEASFAAAHFLRNYRGKCENLHGHNYKVEVIVEGEMLNEAGLLADFTTMKHALRSLTEALDHRHLNETPPFDVLNPSAENLARYFYDRLEREHATSGEGGRIAAVKVWETERQYATYRPK